MAIARVVTFEGVSADRMQQMKSEMEGNDPPEGMNPQELIVMHDPETEKSLVVVLFENDDEYRKGDEVLSNMPAGDTPGQRTSVTRYEVPIHRTM
jgi:hypothetical protein